MRQEQPRKVAIVTGGASGVGAATARLLAQRGYHILVNYQRSAEMAQAVVDECQALGADALAVAGNVAVDADCRALVQHAVTRWGRIDALVNSAAATKFVPMSHLDGVQAQDFQTIFGVNAVGPFQLCRAAAQHMGEGSAIVNVSSIAGQTGSGSSFPYVLSKAALNALTLGLARTLAPGIRVNAVLPGMIEGRWMRDGLGDEAYQQVKTQFADTALLGRVCTPQQIAGAIGWLLDPDCMMTGQLMVVDGGFMLGRPPAAAGAR
ncbi:SDR family oxidoreductase [Polaromonas sp. P1-6]|nr:SDR family oxidoreductase [Polaromonas sp. P1-6]